MLHQLAIIMFVVTAGFTASGIAANLYRLVADKPQTAAGKTVYFTVMVVAGPSVLFENAAKKAREKSCSKVAFGLAAAVAAYWSFAIGVFILNVGLAL